MTMLPPFVDSLMEEPEPDPTPPPLCRGTRLEIRIRAMHNMVLSLFAPTAPLWSLLHWLQVDRPMTTDIF